MRRGSRTGNAEKASGGSGRLPWFGGTVRWRLTLWHAMILAVAFAIFGLVVERFEAKSLEGEFDRHLLGNLQAVALAVDHAYHENPPLSPAEIDDEIQEISVPADTIFRLEMPDGRVFSQNSGAISAPIFRKWQRTPMPSGVPWTVSAAGRHFRLVRLEGSEGSKFAGSILLARDLSAVEAQLGSLRRILALILPAVFILAVAGGYWLSSRALRPVERITERARRIEAQGLNQRIELQRPDDEFGRLAQVLNDLFGRLERAFLQQRRFLADAAHELRTPVAVVRSQTDVALQQVRPAEEYARALQAIRSETEHLSAIVDDLLLIARVDSSQVPAPKEPVDFVEIVDECCRSLRPLAEERRLKLLWNVGEEVEVRADGRLLRRAAANLIINAIHYTQAGGSIAVGIRRGPDCAVLEVADTGVGIAPEVLPHLFDRFYRGRESGGFGPEGSGLGLAIVKMIAELHGGNVTVDSRPGKGSTFSLALPVG